MNLDDRRRHIYCVGKTGVGKSTFLQNLIDDDLTQGRGFALLDPHGDLAEAIAGKIPNLDQAIYFDPSATTHHVAFNPLENVPPDLRPLVASQVVASFKAIWGASWGPRMEYILYQSLRLLLDSPTTLLGLPRLLVDDNYRAKLLRRCRDPVVASYWDTEFDAYDDRFRQEAISPIQNKIGALLATPSIRNVIGQEHSTLHIPHIMNTGKVLIANLSKGRLGEAPANLLGALLITAFAQAAESRSAMPESERRDFTLYADEFQNFATDSFATILSEARKYRLALVLGHQYLGQLPESLRQAVLGNAGTVVVFRVGAEDAMVLARELDWSAADLADLSNYTARMKTIRNGVPLDASFLRTYPPDPSLGTLQAVRNRTNARHARPRAQVENAITKFLT